jgi:hypothetical protein
VAVTVTAEGGHIAELIEKRSGVNPLWSPPWRSIEPSTFSLDIHPEYGHNSESKLLAGILGHNLALDIFGEPSEEEFAAGITVHGEASVAPYELEVRGGSLTARAKLPIAMLEFERAIRLAGGGLVVIREMITNLLGIDRPIAWTQHVTLGPPFIQHGATRMQIPAVQSMVFPGSLGEHQIYEPGALFDWPFVPTKDGGKFDLSVFPASDHSAGVTCHLVPENCERGFFTAWQPATRVLCGYAWKRSDFPWISLWEENRSRTSMPWNGNTVTRGIEFGASPFAEGRRKTIDRGSLLSTPTYRWLPAKATITVEYCAFVRQSDSLPESLPEGI